MMCYQTQFHQFLQDPKDKTKLNFLIAAVCSKDNKYFLYIFDSHKSFNYNLYGIKYSLPNPVASLKSVMTFPENSRGEILFGISFSKPIGLAILKSFISLSMLEGNKIQSNNPDETFTVKVFKGDIKSNSKANV